MHQTHLKLGACFPVSGAVELGDVDILIPFKLLGQIFPSGYQTLAVTAPRGIKFHKCRALCYAILEVGPSQDKYLHNREH